MRPLPQTRTRPRRWWPLLLLALLPAGAAGEGLVVLTPAQRDPVVGGVLDAARARGKVVVLPDRGEPSARLRGLLSAHDAQRLLRVQPGPPLRLTLVDADRAPWSAPLSIPTGGAPEQIRQAARLRTEFLLDAPPAPAPVKISSERPAPRPKAPPLPEARLADLRPPPAPAPPAAPSISLPPAPRPPPGQERPTVKLKISGPPGPVDGPPPPPQPTIPRLPESLRAPTPPRIHDLRLGLGLTAGGPTRPRAHASGHLALSARWRLGAEAQWAWVDAGGVTSHWPGAALRLEHRLMGDALRLGGGLGASWLVEADEAPWRPEAHLGLSVDVGHLGEVIWAFEGRLSASPGAQRLGGVEAVAPWRGWIGLHFRVPLTDETPKGR